jgi:hypothetical protein
MMTTPPAVMMPVMPTPVAAMPSAVTHDFDGGDLVRRGGDAGAETGRRRGRELRRGENDRRAGKSHQNELAHGFTSVSAPSAGEQTPAGLNSM